LQSLGYQIINLSTNYPYKLLLKPFRLLDLISSRFLGITLKPITAMQDLSLLKMSNVVISFVDSFSISLAFLKHIGLLRSQKLVGVFHRLSDITVHSPWPFQSIVRFLVAHLLSSLDYVLFMGEPDRRSALQLYKLNPSRTLTLQFGVDTTFWHPSPCLQSELEIDPYYFSVGQDLNRDYKTLIEAKSPINIRIHTSHDLSALAIPSHITVSSGSYQRSTLSDIELRSLYQSAVAVIVPLHNVFQPSGCSVTLQAMACGTPVILTRTKGFWAPDLLQHMENIVLVEPGQPDQLSFYLYQLYHDISLRSRLSQAARLAVTKNFSADVLPKQLHAIFSSFYDLNTFNSSLL